MSIEVTPSEASYFNLTRHHLVERLPREKALEAVGDILGLNAQGALNYQLSLWNRVEGLDPSFLPRALQEDRSLVRSWFMRDTVHIVPSADLSVFRQGLEEGLMREWNRWTVRTGRKEVPESWEPLYPEILDALEGDPLTLNGILERVGWKGEEVRSRLHRLVREMSLKGLVCNAGSRGPWYHNSEHLFSRIDRWIPEADLSSVSPSDAIKELVLRYLRAYGPASVSDFSYWSGTRVREARPVFEENAGSLIEVTIEGQKGRYYALAEDEQALMAVRSRPFARLMPQFDALIMGHKDKLRFIDPSDRGYIFLPRANVVATILVNGKVKGTWQVKKGRKGWELSLQPSQVLSSEEKVMIGGEIEQMREFTGFEILVKWLERS
jgi:hypothetical protein